MRGVFTGTPCSEKEMARTGRVEREKEEVPAWSSVTMVLGTWGRGRHGAENVQPCAGRWLGGLWFGCEASPRGAGVGTLAGGGLWEGCRAFRRSDLAGGRKSQGWGMLQVCMPPPTSALSPPYGRQRDRSASFLLLQPSLPCPTLCLPHQDGLCPSQR